MKVTKVLFSQHALQRMYERKIGREEVLRLFGESYRIYPVNKYHNERFGHWVNDGWVFVAAFFKEQVTIVTVWYNKKYTKEKLHDWVEEGDTDEGLASEWKEYMGKKSVQKDTELEAY